MTLPIGSTGTLQTLGDTSAPTGPLNVSIVTRIKNRKGHMLEALPTWLKLPVAEIIVVDWGSSDADLRKYIDFLDDDRIVLVTRDESEFQRSRAWNIGIAQASAEWVFLLDCDVKVMGPVFADPMFAVPNYGNFYRPYTDRYLPSLFGCAIVLKEHWQAVGGFNEDLIGWGWEDVDFCRRLVAKGYREVTIPAGHFQPLPHADEDRTAHHREKDLRLSVAANAYRASQVADIELSTTDLGTLHRSGADVRAACYQQTISYRQPSAAIQRLVESREFSALVKKFNVFDTPIGVLELFNTDEFKALARRKK